MKTPSADWARIEPLLDEALQTLDEPDRCALLLRYFENKSLREVGETLGTSDDAAQKRISRALDRLRTRFARAGVTLTSAGLIADLSAHAIVTAPSALGAAISAATVASGTLLGSSVAGAAHTLILTQTQKILAVALAAALAGGVIYQTLTVRRQPAEFSAAQDRFGRSSAELAQLQRATEAARLRALTLQTEFARPISTKPGSDPAMAAEIAAWFARLEKLKTLFVQRPTAAIPEMSLLSEKDWFDAARDSEFTTDEKTRQSLAGLRGRAKSKLVEPLKKALVQYVDAHDGVLPADAASLAPFMELSVTPAMLARYEMLRDGKLMSVPFADWLLAERAPLDEEFDTRVFVSINSRGTSEFTDVSRPELQKALRIFMAAHSDQPPASSEQLLPYFQNTLSQLATAAFLKKYPAGLSSSDLKKLLTPR